MDSSRSTINIDDLSENGELDPDLDEPTIPIPLTSAKSSPLKTLHIEYIDDLPEYPTSHVQGYTYVVASRGRSQAEMEQILHEIQYAKRQTQGRKRPVYCPFLLCHAHKWTWKCSGIYTCEYLRPSLLDAHHTAVDEVLWHAIQQSQHEVQILEDISKRNAYNFYRAKVKAFQKGIACLEHLPTCKPIFKRYTQANVLGEYPPYVGCANETYGLLNKHHRAPVQGHAALDLQFLEDLFNKEALPASKECGVFEPLSSRRKFCERDHPQGPGRLKHTSCDVIFTALVPVDLNQCPYVLFTSHGTHKHPPPPPTKPPEQILQGIKLLIQQVQDLTLSTTQFLRSPQLEAFCQQYNTSTLAEIHASFCNKDRIKAIIEKQHLLSYPNGQSLNSLIFLQEIDGFIKDYVQEVYHDSEGTMVICGFKDQIQLLARLSSFKVDISYKRVRHKGMNEALFAAFLPDRCKVITLLRAFTSEDSTRGYYLLFKRVFTLIEKVTQRPTHFDPIHGSGIYGIIMAMDSNQYTGLGEYLSEIDPRHRDLEWQLEHIIVFCRDHFQRSIFKAIGSKSRGSLLWRRMMSLLDCHSEAEYDELLELLINYQEKMVQDWALQKKSPIIKAGLNQACSKIQPHYFQIIRRHNNDFERSYRESNVAGKYLTLVDAVKNSANLDKDEIFQYQNFTQFEVRHPYQTSNMEVNYLRDMNQKGSRKRQRSVSSSTSESQLTIPQPQNIPRSRSHALPQNSDHNPVQSSQDLQRVASTNALSLEQRRQELEIRQLEIDIKKQEADIKQQEEVIRLQQLQNEQLELDLMERRIRIQDLQASRLSQAISD